MKLGILCFLFSHWSPMQKTLRGDQCRSKTPVDLDKQTSEGEQWGRMGRSPAAGSLNASQEAFVFTFKEDKNAATIIHPQRAASHFQSCKVQGLFSSYTLANNMKFGLRGVKVNVYIR